MGDAKVGANETEDASKGPFTSIPGNFNQLSAAEKAAITERYKREQEERLHRTMNKLRDTTGTMAGLGNLDNSYGSIGQRRPGKRSDDVMDKVAEAMAYRQRHAEEIKRRQEKKAQEAAEAKAKEATAAAAAATATETKTTGGSGTEEAKEENTEKKGWFSKWF